MKDFDVSTWTVEQKLELLDYYKLPHSKIDDEKALRALAAGRQIMIEDYEVLRKLAQS